MPIKLWIVPALTTVPDAQRPTGKFITEYVLPRWEQLNSFRSLLRHSRMMALMLRRRRVHVHQVQGIIAAYLFNGETVGGQYGRLTTLVSDQAFEACHSKSLARRYFAAAGLPVPEGRSFSADQKGAAADLISGTGPWVMKPDAARHSRGVSFGVTESTFEAAWAGAVEANPRSAAQVMIEQFQDAISLRFYVVGSMVQAVAARVPLFVVGDGTSSLRQLLAASFEARQVNPLLRITLPEISQGLLGSSGRSLDEVPGPHELVLLSEDGNLRLGGIPVDVTEAVHPALNDLAVSAAHAIPGLGAAGVDLLTPDVGSTEDAVVLDADAWSNTRMHRYPALGRPRRAGAIAAAEQILLRAKYWDKPVLPPESQDPDDD